MLTLKPKIIMGILHLFWVIFFIIVLIDVINYVLFIASSRGYEEVVKELLNHNADIEAKNNDGDTPLINGISFIIVVGFYIMNCIL
jgi:hypothetical protein